MNKFLNEKREKYYHRQIIKAIGLENTPIAFGAEKKCHIFKNFVVFSHHIGTFDDKTMSDFILNLLVKFQNTQYLANYGITTPRILDIELNDDCIYEIQERAPGQVLSYTNESNIFNVFGERQKGFTGLSDMSDTLRADLISRVLTYNFNMQKKMKSAPIAHFVDFIRSFKDIQEYGLYLDIHGENFLYDPIKGFSFIDLPSTQSTSKKKFTAQNLDSGTMIFNNRKIKNLARYRKISDFYVAKQVCGLFGFFLKYCNYSFDLDLVKQMKKNNYSLFKNKLFPAIKDAGFNLSNDEWNNLAIYASKFANKEIKLDNSIITTL